MARVYRARDEGLSVERAIKVLDPGLTSGAIRRRFILEAKTMAGLEHPNLVTVHDVHAEEPVFLVLELMVGSVHHWLANHGAMPPRMAVEVVRGVLRGLAHAHARGIVHRDVKPQNVLIASDGTAKLTDFGIARVDSARSLTRTGAVMGTYAYMPPEQRASAKHVDHRADVYSTGATLFALVTDEEPFDLFATESHAARFEGVPEQLRSVIVAACRYEPSDRFADAEAMEKALEVATAALPDVPEGTPPLWRCGKRNAQTTIDEELSVDAAAPGSGGETWSPRRETAAMPQTGAELSVGLDAPVTEPPVELPRGPLFAGLALLVGVLGVVGWNLSQTPDPVPVVVEELPPVLEVVEEVPLIEVEVVEGETVAEVSDEALIDEVVAVDEPRVLVEDDPVVVDVEDDPVIEVVEVVEVASTEPGMLIVNTIPWGYVKVDDGARRRTAWEGEVSPGDHTVVMEAYDGRPPKTLTLPVPAEGELVFCWDFNKQDRCTGSP